MATIWLARTDWWARMRFRHVCMYAPREFKVKGVSYSSSSPGCDSVDGVFQALQPGSDGAAVGFDAEQDLSEQVFERLLLFVGAGFVFHGLALPGAWWLW